MKPHKIQKKGVQLILPTVSLIKSFTSLPPFELKHLLEKCSWQQKNVSKTNRNKLLMCFFEVISTDGQTHQTRSPPRPPRSRNPSPHHISMTTRHTCWWIPHSQISLEGTSVCLWAEMKELRRLLQWFYGPIKAAKKQLQDTARLDFYRPRDAVKTHPKLHHTGQLILLTGPPPKRHAVRSWNTANAQLAVKQKSKPAPPPPFSCQSARVGTGSVWSRLQCV